jgi:hypothetical protein
MIKNLKIQQQTPPPRKRLAKIQFRTTESESGYDDSMSSDFSESEIELSTESEYEDEPLVHAIILPNYKEDMDTLRETLEVLASHLLASSSYEVRNIRLRTSLGVANIFLSRYTWQWKPEKLELQQKPTSS